MKVVIKKELTMVANLTTKVMIYGVLRSVNVTCCICDKLINHPEPQKLWQKRAQIRMYYKTHLMTDYVASFKIRPLHDLRDSHALEHLAFGTSQILWMSEFSMHMLNYVRMYNATNLPSKARTHRKLISCSTTSPLLVLLPIGILPPPSSHYAFFPAKLKFCVCFKNVISDSLFFFLS
jgi:hypothetical protein